MVKIHSCQTAMNAAERVFEEKTGRTLLCHKEATPFAFAGPDVFKYDTSIDTFTAYKNYISIQTLGLHLIIFVTHPKNQIGYNL